MHIVDTDIHVRELPGELAEHCEMPWRVALEAIPESAPTASFGSSLGDYYVPGLAQGSGGRVRTALAGGSESSHVGHVAEPVPAGLGRDGN